MDLEMDTSEPSDGSEAHSQNKDSNPPLLFPNPKLQVVMCQDAECDAPAKSFGFKTPVRRDDIKLPPFRCGSTYKLSYSVNFSEASELTLGNTCPSSVETKRMRVMLSPDSGFSESQLSVGSESTSLLSNILGVEGSYDSGMDSFSSSRMDSADTDLDEDVPPVKLPSAPDHLSNSERIQTVDRISKIYQSTPANADVKIPSLTFGTPLDSASLEKSPTKRHRAILRKSSRDLFQSSKRKGSVAFRRPFLGDYPTAPSLMKSSMVGRETLDFVSYLGKHANMQPALSAILGYLEPVDLCRACLVSRSWKNVIESSPQALQRKTEFVNLSLQMKENLHKPVKKTEVGDVLPHRGQLMAIQNLSRNVEVSSAGSRSPPVSPSKVRFNLFLKEGRKLESGQTLLQCPQCKLPSRKETGNSARCTRRGCQYYFCILCHCKFHGDKSCPVSVRHRKRQAAIGSRESRRNLQRLCK